MNLTGELLIGQQTVKGTRDPIVAINVATGERLPTEFFGGTSEDVARACELAWSAFDTYRETSLEERARFLETIADEIEAIGDDLIERAVAEDSQHSDDKED